MPEGVVVVKSAYVVDGERGVAAGGGEMHADAARQHPASAKQLPFLLPPRGTA
jgi:hypothetical protein